MLRQRFSHTLFPILAVLACQHVAAATKPLPHEWLPVERCAPTFKAPAVDGKLDDDGWQMALRTKPFVTPSGDKTKLETRARVAHDRKTLFIGVECADPNPAGLVKDHAERDTDVYVDDCVEVFIDANLDFRTYFHLLINAGNVQRDEKGDLAGTPMYDVSWNAKWQSAARVGGKGWTVEIAIPFAELGIELFREEAIGVNVCRSAKAANELSCWVPTQGGFHNPHRNATVILARDPVAAQLGVEVTTLGSLRPERSETAWGTATNRGADPLDLEAEIRIGSNKELKTSREVIGPLGPGESGDGGLSYRYGKGTGPHNLCVMIRESRTGELLYVANVFFSVPLLSGQKFGSRLPSPQWSSLWWAESTYKIRPGHEAPDASAETVEVSAAGNEYEAFQLVLTPTRDVRDVSLGASAFRGPRGVIGAGNVDLFRVEYVNADKPTDAFGSAGLWPDPLPPLKGPVDLAADEDAVFWVRLHVPKGTPGGEYEGNVELTAPGEALVEVRVKLKVFDFSLTDETHTRIAYGLGPDWGFLGLKDRAQQEQVFEKYLWAFKEHRLSPYNPFAFHPMKHELHGPQWRINNGPLELVIDKFSSRYFTILYKGTKVGELTNTMTQFEKKGVGYQNTGVGWPGITRLKDVKIVERSPQRWVVEVTGEKTTSGAASRRYEITFRFTLPAGRPQFWAEMIRFKNTDSIRYEMRGYYYILRPADDKASKNKAGSMPNGYWLLPDANVLGAVAHGGNASFDLAPIYVQKSTWLEPGQEIAGFGPKMVFFAGEAAPQAPGKTSAGHTIHLQDVLADGGVEALAPAPGRTITADVQDDVRVTFDFEDFDRVAAKYLDGWRFNGFNFRAMPGSIAGHPRFTPEYSRLHKMIHGPMIAHLREKGWLDKAYSYWIDEPTEEQYAYVNQGTDLLARNCPGLARLLTEQVEEALIGHPNLWVPVLSNYNPERCQARQKAGDLVWWYVCCGPRAPYPNNFIDHPAINHRIRFWMMEKYGVTGSLYWATTYWRGKDGKLRNPWESAEAISPSGGFWGNGDGMLLYPACREPAGEPCLDGPVITQRIECIRDGLEDREYFWTLKKLAEQAKRQRVPNVSELLAEAEEALAAPGRLATSLTEFTKDPQELLRERARVAEVIEELREALREAA